ncbi:MAG TPA: diguanylate cyclase [Mycobacteriales bacterium]|nr:diguanylate cyclase [Mycobacteriales bacterium]
MTLRVRLSLAFLLVVALPLVVAVIVVGRGVPQALDSAARNRLSSSRAGAVALVEQTCTTARLAAEVLAREAVTSPGRAATDVVGRGLAAYAVVVDTNGRITGQAGHLTGGAEPSPIDLGSCSRQVPPRSGLAAIADSVEVHSDNGRALGSAAVAVPFDSVTATHLAAAANASVTLLSGNAVVVSTLPPRSAQRVAKVGPTLPRDGSARAVSGLLASAASLGPGEPIVVMSVPRAGQSGLEGLLVVVLLIAILLAALIGWLLARVVTRPLAELSDAAARVAGGDLETRIDVRSGDEVGRLADAFNEMTDELREHIGALQSSRDEMRRGLARLGETLSSTHDLNRILSVILETAITTTRSAAGSLLVLQDNKDELVLRAGRNVEALSGNPALRLPVGVGIAGTVAATGEALHGASAELAIAAAAGEPAATQLISVPLRTGRGVLGVLNLYDRVDGRPFNDSDLDAIRSFAGQAAVAVDNVLLHQEAQRLSVTDGLTGLGNYRYFQQTLAREVDRAARFSRPLALLMLDLDRFKLVNDEHGHQVGDAVLTQVAERVRAEVREVDVVARYGGEEFVAILPETDTDGAARLAERIRQSIRSHPMRTSGGDLSITVSIGVAVYPGDGEAPAALVRAADQALYAAKSEGRDCWRVAGR